MNSRVPSAADLLDRSNQSEERGERGASRASYRYHHNGKWHLVDEEGIRVVSANDVLAICEAQPLTFDVAINLSREFFSKGDEAEDRGDAASEEQWSTWGEQLEIWAASYFPAPGKVTTTFIRTAVHHDDQAVSFAAFTRRN